MSHLLVIGWNLYQNVQHFLWFWKWSKQQENLDAAWYSVKNDSKIRNEWLIIVNSLRKRVHNCIQWCIPMSGFPQHSWCQAHSAGRPEGHHLSAWALQTPVNTGNTMFSTLHWRNVFKCRWTKLDIEEPISLPPNKFCVERKHNTTTLSDSSKAFRWLHILSAFILWLPPVSLMRSLICTHWIR